jgi:hypothetical protein
MVIYTCILRKNTNYYECMKGNFDYIDFDLLDYKNISVPSSTLQFPIFQQIQEFNYVKFSLPLQYQKSMKARFEN